jgi:DNA polymerase-3 subunit gamma/tau
MSAVSEKMGLVAEEKQYQSLYRKYRPQSPQDILGQEHVVRALEGAVNEGRLAHAFLFCGPRGTGKTSTARILAKMVNCEKGPTATPCGECEQCLRIRDGNSFDVVEIDAASHGGVDDARELRERAPTAPMDSREKVYIIDEAQRLSAPAFDALLKLFEEPPPGVRFILATTEPHKMPATIVGRCQRFDFRRVPIGLLSGHLVEIASKEGLKLDPATAETIARYSEGSVRDALSLLDQASVLADGEIGEEVLEQLLGVPPSEMQASLADAIAVGDTKTVFSIVNRLVQEGQDLRHVTSETLTHFRNLLIAHTAPGQADLLDVTSDEYERIRTQAQKFTAPEISRVISLLLAAQTDMRWTTSPRLTFELALIRACMPDTDPNPPALISRVERLERLSGLGGDAPVDSVAAAGTTPVSALETPAAVAAVPDAPPDVDRSAAKRKPKKEPAPSKAAPAPPAPTQAPVPISTGVFDIELLRKNWTTVIQHLKTQKQSILVAMLEIATPVSYDGETLELAFPPDRKFAVGKVEAKEAELRSALQELFGTAPKIRCLLRGEVTAEPSTEDDEDDAPADDAEALARVQAALGAEVAPELEG